MQRRLAWKLALPTAVDADGRLLFRRAISIPKSEDTGSFLRSTFGVQQLRAQLRSGPAKALLRSLSQASIAPSSFEILKRHSSSKRSNVPLAVHPQPQLLVTAAS